MAVYYDYNDLIPHFCISELVNHIEESVVSESAKHINVPQRNMIYKDDGHSAYFSMPALSDAHQLYITKVATFKARAANDKNPSINSVVVAFDSNSGKLSAIFDGTAITNIKCAAVSAYVTKYCTEDRPHTLAILGSGVQAQQQLKGLSSVRNITKLKLWSRTQSNATQLAAMAKQNWLPNCDISVVDHPEQALHDATIIATTTSSHVPIADFSSLRPDVHINCMGAHTPESREIPHQVLKHSTLIVEDIDTACAEAGEYHNNAIEIPSLARLPSVQEDMTIFSSTGHALYDLLTTSYLLQKLHNINYKDEIS